MGHQGDKLLRVIVSDVVAVKPNILRVSLYTINQTDDGQETVGGDYELIVLAQDFTQIQDDGSVAIDLSALQLNLTKQIVNLQWTNGLAQAVMNADMAWEIKADDESQVTEEKETPKGVQGMSLAYGDNVNDEPSNSERL